MPEMNTKQPRQSTRRSAWPRWIAAAAVTAMLATACASESGSTSDTADTPDPATVTTSTSAVPADTTVPTSTQGEPANEVEETTTTPPSTTEHPVAEIVSVSAESHLFGGVQFAYDSDLWVVHLRTNELIVAQPLDTATLSAPPRQSMGIGRLSQTFAGQPVSTIDEAIEVIEVAAGGTVTPQPSIVSLFGVELSAFEVNGADANRPLFSGHDLGFSGEAWWNVGDETVVHLGELDDSLIAVFAGGLTTADRDAAEETVLDIAATMRLLSDTIPPLPTPTTPVPVDLGQELVIEAAERKDNGVSTFREATFQPPATRQQLLQFGFHMEMTFPTDVIVPRYRPGYFAMGDELSFGEYHLDLRAHLGAGWLVPMGLGPVPIGDPVEIADIAAVVDNPPANLVFTDVDIEATVGGLPAVSFAVSIDDDLGCSGALVPCSWAFMGPDDEFAQILGWGHEHRVWIVPDVPNGPLVLMASGPGGPQTDAWLERAEEVVASLEIDLG